uniref:hypothetical protein n=1 Tax=Anaerotruncus massiliensis (ex Togo et al. 2019) TaxID=1673720 RepID=UPI0023F4F7C0
VSSETPGLFEGGALSPGPQALLQAIFSVPFFKKKRNKRGARFAGACTYMLTKERYPITMKNRQERVSSDGSSAFRCRAARRGGGGARMEYIIIFAMLMLFIIVAIKK